MKKIINAVENVEEEMIQLFQAKEIPYLIVYNKCDLIGKNIPFMLMMIWNLLSVL